MADPTYPGLAQRRQNAGIKTPTQVEFGRISGFPGLVGQLPGVGTQFEPDPCEDGLPQNIDPGCRGKLPAGHGGPELIWSPDAVLMDTVARLQRDIGEIRVVSRCPQTPGGRASSGHPRQVAFTSTNVPRFARVISWEQNRQVFDAIEWMGRRHGCPTVALSPGRRCAECGSSGA